MAARTEPYVQAKCYSYVRPRSKQEGELGVLYQVKERQIMTIELKRNALREERGFTIKKYATRWKTCQNDTCPVCLEEFKRGEKIAMCPCKHNFHSKCLLQWLEHRNNCPLCKAAVRNSAGETTGLIRPTASSSV